MKPAALCAMALVLCVGYAAAQPGGPQHRRDGGPRQGPPDMDRSEVPSNDPVLLKRFLERRLEDTENRRERLKAALKRLEDGAPAAEVAAEVEPNSPLNRDGMRDGMREGPPGPRGMEHGDAPPRRGDHDGKGGPPPRLTPEDRERAMLFIREEMPNVARRLEQLRQAEGGEADRTLARMWPRLRMVMAAKGRDPKAFEAGVAELQGNMAVFEAVREYRRAMALTPGAERDLKVNEAETRLRAALAQSFENKLVLQNQDVEALSRRLEALKKDLERKRARSTQEIDAMMEKFRDYKESRDGPPHRPPG
jgi:hypothetical protein